MLEFIGKWFRVSLVKNGFLVRGWLKLGKTTKCHSTKMKIVSAQKHINIKSNNTSCNVIWSRSSNASTHEIEGDFELLLYHLIQSSTSSFRHQLHLLSKLRLCSWCNNRLQTSLFDKKGSDL